MKWSQVSIFSFILGASDSVYFCILQVTLSTISACGVAYILSIHSRSQLAVNKQLRYIYKKAKRILITLAINLYFSGKVLRRAVKEMAIDFYNRKHIDE